MKQHIENLNTILQFGDPVRQRNSATREIFGMMNKYLFVGEDFPLMTTKKMPFKTIAAELLCFVRGYTNIKDFQRMGVNIWNANACSDYWRSNPFYRKDSLGRIYGAQWRDWQVPQYQYSIDQLAGLIDGLKKDPHGRRHIVTAWNPGEIDEMCLPPCHCFFQCSVDSNSTLHLMFYQRSCDMFLGVPFNIASYALLQLILCHQTGYKPGHLTHVMGSAHIYESHIPQCHLQINRAPLILPKVEIDKEPGCTLEDYEVTDFKLLNYESHGPIKAEMVI